MKIERKLFGAGEPTTLVEFADKHGLTLKVNERSSSLNENGRLPSGSPFRRYWVNFTNVEIMTKGMLRGATGNGDTVDDAIKDLAGELAGERVVVGAYTKRRIELEVPNDFHHAVKS
jgi:hypothetical protein